MKAHKKALYIVLAVLATIITISIINYNSDEDKVNDFPNHSEIK